MYKLNYPELDEYVFCRCNIAIMHDDVSRLRRELKLRNYSPKTIKSYTRSVQEFLWYLERAQLSIGEQSIKGFLHEKLEAGNLPQTVNVSLSAIKFYCREILGHKFRFMPKFAKRPKKLPVVLSRDEINRILAEVNNAKHRAMIALSYGAGLRVSEVVSLRVRDLSFEDMILHIKAAKGGKDRISIIPEQLRLDLLLTVKGKEGNDVVFESERGGSLSTRSIQKVFQSAVEKSGIKSCPSFHSLRHSFATHLLENGVNIPYVQELLGHRNIKTTMIYTQVSNQALKKIRSPLEGI